MHPHWNSTPKAPPTTDERIAALEEALKMANDCAQQRFAAMQATIDELRAKLQAREPIGRPSIGTPPPWDEHDRISEKVRLAKQQLDQAKRQSDEWQKAAQPDLFPSHKPQEPRHTPRQFLDIEKRQEAWARGYVDPNRLDQGKAHQAMYIPPLGKALSASIDGKQLSTAETRNLINQFWANAQATQAQADRDGENLKK